MNRSETMKALSTIQEVYPHFMDGRTPAKTVDIWQQMFPEPYAVVSTAIIAFISSDTKGYPPNIGQIKEKIAQMADDEPDEMQAWQMVCKAMSRGSRKEFANLPPLIQQCIGSPEMFIEWSLMDTSIVDVTIANGFMRTYRARAQKQREYGKLPDCVRQQYPALEAQKLYELPAPKPDVEWSVEQKPVPDSVIQQVGILRAMAQREELKRHTDVSKRLDGLNDAIDSLQRSST